MTSPSNLSAAARRAQLAEMVWRDDQGGLGAAAVTPLVTDDGGILLALPYDRTRLARRLRDAALVVLAVTDARMLRGEVPAVAAPVRLTVHEDRDGAWTETGLLAQELRKHPPSRRLVATPLQRREQWWYMPRWIVRIHPVAAAGAVPPRSGAEHGLVAWGAAATLRVTTAAVQAWDSRPVVVTPLGGGREDRPAGPCLLFTHDASLPDLERRCAATLTGVLRDGRMAVDAASGSPVLGPPLSLRSRVRAHARLARACRDALRSTHP